MALALVFNQRAVKACDSVKMFGATYLKKAVFRLKRKYLFCHYCVSVNVTV